MKKLAIMLSLFALLFLGACQSNTALRNVDVKEAKQLIDDGQVTVIDVRTEEEFATGHIPNATLLPLDQLESRINELDKNTSYLIVCRSGNRSAQASEILVNNDFSTIYNMENGMNDWTYEIE